MSEVEWLHIADMEKLKTEQRMLKESLGQVDQLLTGEQNRSTGLEGMYKAHEYYLRKMNSEATEVHRERHVMRSELVVAKEKLAALKQEMEEQLTEANNEFIQFKDDIT